MTDIAKNDLLQSILQAQDANEYASCLTDRALLDAFELPAEVDFSSLEQVKCKWSFPGKIRWVKRWFQSATTLLPENVTLHFPLWSKHGCHMDDKGNVSFPLSAFLKRFDPLVKYVFHETAHLYLAKQVTYKDLLALDKLFLSAYGEREKAICLSPVEYFASLLSIRLLERAAKTLGETRLAKRLLMQKGVEERKLMRALDAFVAE